MTALAPLGRGLNSLKFISDRIDDFSADFLRFYGIDIDPYEEDWAGLSCPRFMSLALRVSAYDGMVARRLEMDKESDSSSGGYASTSTDGTDKKMSLAEWKARRSAKSEQKDDVAPSNQLRSVIAQINKEVDGPDLPGIDYV